MLGTGPDRIPAHRERHNFIITATRSGVPESSQVFRSWAQLPPHGGISNGAVGEMTTLPS